MNSRLFIIISALLVSLPVLGQKNEIERPKVGEVQVNLLLGQSSFFSQDETGGYDYLLPADGDNLGFGDPASGQSADPAMFLNLGDMNSNSVVNMVGVKVGVFVHEHFDVNVMFGMNISLTPKKDFIEGDFDIPDMAIPNQQYILGKTNHVFQLQLGSNYYFFPKNKRILPYVGVVTGFQMARVEATTPFTGEETADGDPVELYKASYRAGQVWAIQEGIVAGIDYSLAPGLILGAEICPAMYQYSLMSLHPSGFGPYRAANHSIKLLTMPRLKLAFRF